MTIRHLSQSIEGLLRNNPVGTIDFIKDGNGKVLPDAEARVELNKLLEQGHKFMPMSDKCVGFDPVSGCPGHEPLAGSDLCRAMRNRGDSFVQCYMSNSEDCMNLDSSMWPKIVIHHSSNGFRCADGTFWKYATPINNQGKPLTAQEVGL